MIESLCCALLVLIARITAEVYEKNFPFLNYLLIPLTIGCAVLLGVTVLMVIIKIIKTLQKRSEKW